LICRGLVALEVVTDMESSWADQLVQLLLLGPVESGHAHAADPFFPFNPLSLRD
jgi:hypothetical protein